MDDLTIGLQLLTLLVAGAGPVLAYRYARKLALSSNRQDWLDGLRQDVAELIAVTDSIRLMFSHDEKTTRSPEARELGLKMQTLRMRIWLRLRSVNEAHRQLRADVDAFLAAESDGDRDENRTKLLESAEVLIQRAWNRILRGE